MYVRTAKKGLPAPAQDIQEVLDIITYVLNIINTIYTLLMNILGNFA